MAINISVQLTVGFSPTSYCWLTQCYFHRGTRLNAMKRFCLQSLIPPKRFDNFPPLTGGCSEGLGAFCFFFKHQYYIVRCNQAQTISDERFPMKILAEIAPISARILVENRSSEISDRKLPIFDSVRHGFFLPSRNRQFPIGKNASIRNGLMEIVGPR